MKLDIINKLESYLPMFMLKNHEVNKVNIHSDLIPPEVERIDMSSEMTVFVGDSRTIEEIDEELLERILNADHSIAGFKLTSSFARIRQLNRDLIDDLKKLYKGNCQLCDSNIGEGFGIDISEAHHIEYFGISLNNRPDNIIILCPNHHTLIHKTNLIYDKEKKVFSFPNGYFMKLIHNIHL